MTNKTYSFKNLTNQSFRDLDPKDFEGEIIGSNFYQENKPNSIIFPDGIKTTFIRCNLDNVSVPKDCVIDGGTNKQILVQNDNSDWILDDNGKPIEPIDKKIRETLGISCKSEDIPDEKQETNVFNNLK